MSIMHEKATGDVLYRKVMTIAISCARFGIDTVSMKRIRGESYGFGYVSTDNKGTHVNVVNLHLTVENVVLVVIVQAVVIDYPYTLLNLCPHELNKHRDIVVVVVGDKNKVIRLHGDGV